MTRPEDVALCQELGADRLGFVLAPSSRQVSLPQLDLLLKELRPGQAWVAVVVDASAWLLQELLQRGCPYFQFHGQESPEQCRYWGRFTRVMKALRVCSPEDLVGSWPAQELLLDGARPGQGQVFDWAWVRGNRPSQPFFLAGGLTPENVEAAIAKVQPYGVDVSSGVEESPGQKDPERLKLWMQRVRRAQMSGADSENSGGVSSPKPW